MWASLACLALVSCVQHCLFWLHAIVTAWRQHFACPSQEHSKVAHWGGQMLFCTIPVSVLWFKSSWFTCWMSYHFSIFFRSRLSRRLMSIHTLVAWQQLPCMWRVITIWLRCFFLHHASLSHQYLGTLCSVMLPFVLFACLWWHTNFSQNFEQTRGSHKSQEIKKSLCWHPALDAAQLEQWTQPYCCLVDILIWGA